MNFALTHFSPVILSEVEGSRSVTLKLSSAEQIFKPVCFFEAQVANLRHIL